ncbi:hypothetical protein M3Y99_00414700 [Aphelenchoides fujianensis]|nr:hypothetical protein M3Y99_00414700 [Aphelenchoides fujianensis]
MSVTTVSNQTIHKNRRPNSTHLDQLDKLLETDLYEVNASEQNDPSTAFPNGPFYSLHGHVDPARLVCDSLPSADQSNACVNEREPSNAEEEVERRESGSEGTIYANFSELELQKRADFIDRQPFPPEPDAADEPLRVMQNGWREYKTLGGRSFFFHPASRECQWQPPRSTRTSNTLSKSKTTSEPQRKQSISEMSLSQTATPPLWVDVPKSRSLSTDQASIPSSSSADPFKPVEMIKHATNPLLEQDFCLAGPHERTGMTESFISHRLPRAPTTSTNIDTRTRPSESNKYVNFDESGMSTISSDPLSASHSAANSALTTTFPVLPVDMSFSMPSVNSISSTSRPHDYFTPTSAIHQGTLEKCRLTDGNSKIKKNQWLSTYAFLYSGHLLFYRDQKSAEKTGKHYPPPMDVCDLRGAKLFKVENEKYKDKRHRQIISLHLPSGSVYLFSTDNENELNDWFRALKEAIVSLPYSNVESAYLHEQGSLGRASNKSGLFKKQSTRQSLKNATKQPAVAAKEKVEAEVPPRESIIDRLLRFLRHRPTMEHLSERGIYRPEPVFGSTLTAVCEHDGLPVPRFITEVTETIEKRGLLMDGIYRVSGNLSSIQKLRCNIDQDRYDALNKEEDVHVLTGALKLFLRELAEPLFPSELNKEFMSAMKEQPRARVKVYDERLPEPNRATLIVLVSHLRRVARHSSENRMQIHNLAIVFGPALFHSEGRATKTHQRRNSGFLSKKTPPPAEPQVVPSQNLAYKMVVFGQVAEFILNQADKFQVFAGVPL